MSFNKVVANMMAGSNIKIIHGEVVGNANPYIEWIKWLSYIPKFQEVRLQEVSSKKVEELTGEEIDELNTYKRQNRILKLFKLYGTKEISKDEYMEVYNFMVNQSIDELMLSKLTIEELRYAKSQIQYFSEIASEELRKKVNEERKADNYENLSMVDSYILHVISKISFAKSIIELDRKIEAQVRENAAMRERSLYYAVNPYTKKIQ